MGTTGVADLFYLLESNKLVEVEEIKKVFYDHFLSTKDNWLVTGLFDYYLSTNSLRVIEVLTSVREPHDKHLLDKLTETMMCKPMDRDQRMKVITFLGHIVRRQPTWLYKLANHSLFKELLKILKSDGDILLLMSALLLLVMLLPILPAALGPFLQEIFETFGRLSTYHYQQLSAYSPSTLNNLSKEHLYLLHFQVGLYGLFHRLYAMYPCNFITYLKQQYTQKEQLSTFANSVRPMLDSVRMHPNLVTSSKDVEISATRWKKMEHHDVMAECGRFTLDKCREEISSFIDRSLTPVNNIVYTQQGGGEGYEIENDMGGVFWSPSMMVSPNSPPSREPRSAPMTPNNNNNSVSNGNNSGTSPPEAAVEATPETTPVKDLRKLITRPINSTAVRALNVLGTSRPSTPTIIENKINKLVNDRQLVQPREELNFSHNGKMETSWQEDQEVLEIVSGSKGGIDVNEFGHRVYRLLVNSRFGREENEVKLERQIVKSRSCPILHDVETEYRNSYGIETSTQTEDSAMFPYEFLLLNVMDKTHDDDKIERLSPTSMLDRYVEACARTTTKTRSTTTIRRNKQKAKKNQDETVNEESGVTGENGTIGEIDTGGRNYSLELMLMQLQFERQRREVYAERNRRLIGKLRDSRALEELNLALNDRLRLMEKELEQLKLELDRNKKESYDIKEQYKESVSRWQYKCTEEEEKNRTLRDCCENFELQLKREEEKMKEVERKNRSIEADFFDATHRLKGALKAANRGKELESNFNTMQKKFLLLGEVQARCKENSNSVGIGSSSQSVGKSESSSNVQKCYAEELNNLKRQLESKTSLLEAMKTRLTELESKEQRRETQTIELQRTLQEMKEKHEAELKSFESKYQAQLEINTLLEGRILELNGQLELATVSMAHGSGCGGTTEPIKERSPTLSVSLASSSEGSLAFIQSINPVTGSGSIMNEYCDNVVEISNLQAIVDDH